jgi:hypothetical protein
MIWIKPDCSRGYSSRLASGLTIMSFSREIGHSAFTRMA